MSVGTTALAFAPYANYPATASTSWFSAVGMAAGNVSSASGVTAETSFQSRVAVAGTINNAYVNVISNGRGTATTFTLYKNGSPSTLVVSVGSGVTGVVSDTSHSVSVAVDDTLTVECANSTGAGQLRLASYVAQFNPSSGTAQALTDGDVNGSNSSASFTVYLNIGGIGTSNGTEANIQSQINVAGTLSNYSINVTTNTRLTNGSLRLRKNGANGNGNVVITAATTGIFKDTSNTDTVANTDLIALQLNGGTGATAFVWNAASCSLAPTTDGEQFLGFSLVNTFSTSPMNLSPFGVGLGNATEANVQGVLGMAGTLSRMWCKITTNAAGATTWVSRVNGAGGNQTISVGAAGTGVFTDTSNTDAINATDKINIQVTGANANIITRTGGFKFLGPTSGGGATAALTGNSSTAAEGTLGVQHANALTGNSSTAGRGTLAPKITVALTGNSMTAQRGTLTPSTTGPVTVALTGNGMTAGRGTLSVQHANALTGNALTAGRGTLAPKVSVALTGNQSTASEGTLTPSQSGNVSVALTGITMTARQGLLTAVAPSATGVGGHFIPLTEKQVREQKKRERRERQARDDIDETRRLDALGIEADIRATLAPKPEAPINSQIISVESLDEDDADLEILLMHA